MRYIAYMFLLSSLTKLCYNPKVINYLIDESFITDMKRKTGCDKVYFISKHYKSDEETLTDFSLNVCNQIISYKIVDGKVIEQ